MITRSSGADSSPSPSTPAVLQGVESLSAQSHLARSDRAASRIQGNIFEPYQPPWTTHPSSLHSLLLSPITPVVTPPTAGDRTGYKQPLYLSGRLPRLETAQLGLTDSHAPISYAAPLTPLRPRDIEALQDFFDRADMFAIEANVDQHLLRLLPEPCWEEDPFEFLREFL